MAALDRDCRSTGARVADWFTDRAWPVVTIIACVLFILAGLGWFLADQSKRVECEDRGGVYVGRKGLDMFGRCAEPFRERKGGS